MNTVQQSAVLRKKLDFVPEPVTSAVCAGKDSCGRGLSQPPIRVVFAVITWMIVGGF